MNEILFDSGFNEKSHNPDDELWNDDEEAVIIEIDLSADIETINIPVPEITPTLPSQNIKELFEQERNALSVTQRRVFNGELACKVMDRLYAEKAVCMPLTSHAIVLLSKGIQNHLQTVLSYVHRKVYKIRTQIPINSSNSVTGMQTQLEKQPSIISLIPTSTSFGSFRSSPCSTGKFPQKSIVPPTKVTKTLSIPEKEKNEARVVYGPDVSLILRKEEEIVRNALNSTNKQDPTPSQSWQSNAMVMSITSDDVMIGIQKMQPSKTQRKHHQLQYLLQTKLIMQTKKKTN